MKKILWFSRNAALPKQIEELKKLYGEDCTVKQYGRKVSSADDIVNLYNTEKADDMVVVAPLSVIAALCERKMNPLYAQMDQVSPEDADVCAKGRGYKFKEFKRIKRVAIEFFDTL